MGNKSELENMIPEMEDASLRKILLETLEKNDGAIPEKDKLGILELVIGELNHQTTAHIRKANEQIHEGIEELKKRGKWTNFRQIAEHALESAIEVLSKSDKEILKSAKEHFEAELWFSKLDGRERLRIYKENTTPDYADENLGTE